MNSTFDLIFLCFAGFLAFCALIQARRGGIRSCISFVIVLVSALFAFFAAQPIATAIISADISSAGLSYSDIGVEGVTGTVKSFEELITTLLTSTPEIAQIVEASPNIEALVKQLPVALMAQILFIMVFLFLKPVTLLIYAIAKCFVPKREKEPTPDKRGRMRRKKLKKHWLPGFAFCLARSLVCISVFMIPVTGVFGLLDKTATAFEEAGLSENAEMKDTVDMLKGAVDDYKGGTVYPILETVQLNNLYNAAFHQLSAIQLDGGQTSTSLITEVEKLLPLIGNAAKLSSLGEGNIKSADLETIADIIRSLGTSDLVAAIASDILSDTAAGLSAGEERFGMKLSEMGLDAQTEELILNLLGTFSTTDTAALKVDLNVLADCIDIIASYGIVESVIPADGEEVDIGAVLEAITKKVEIEGEDSAFVQALFGKLAESPRFVTVIPELTNYVLYMASDMMGIPYDKETMYDNMMNDVNTTLNDNNVSNIDMAKVEEGIENNLAPAPGVAYLPLHPELMLLSSGDDDVDAHYRSFITMMQGIIKALDKAGMKYDGNGITYTNELGTKNYRYDDVTGLWTEFTPEIGDNAAADKKVSEVASFAKALIKEAKTSAEESADGKVTLEGIKTITDKVATAAGAETGIGKIAKSFENKDKLVENSKKTVFFKEHIAIDTSKFDQKDTETFASAMNDLLVVAKDVVTLIPEDGGDMDITVATQLLKGDTLEKLGGVLDKLNSMEATPDNFSANLLQGAVDVLGDDESMKPVKDALNGVIDGIKNGEDLSYGEVLGGVSSITATIMDLVDYIMELEAYMEADKEGDTTVVAPDRVAAEANLASGLKGIVGMKPATLTLLVNSVVDMIEGLAEEDAGEATVILTELLGNIASYAPADKDTAINNDAKQIMGLFHFIAEVSMTEEEPEAHVMMSQIMTYIADSDLLSHMSAQIVHDFAAALQNGETYFGVELDKSAMYTAGYLADPTAATMGDRYVEKLFNIMMKADAEGNSTLTKEELRLAAEVFMLFTDADGDSNDFELYGSSLAETVDLSKANTAVQDDIAALHEKLAGTDLAALVTIYGE